MINTTDKIGTISYNGTPLEVDKDLATKTITANGTYNAQTVDSVDGYSEVTVNVSPNVGTKNITNNGTYTASTDSLDGYSEVTVNVTAQPNLGTKSITTNGTYAASSDSLDGYSSVTVNVSGGGGTTYSITYNLGSGWASNNSMTEVPANGCFGAIIRGNSEDVNFSVTMGGSQVGWQYLENNAMDGGYVVVAIPQVTGNLVVSVEPYIEEPEEEENE